VSRERPFTTPPPPANSSCSTPEAIAGAGTLPFDSSISTASRFDGNGGAPCAGINHHRDVFFVWTASSDGDWQFDTIGTLSNTRMAAHDGIDCAATCLDFGEDRSGGVALLIVLIGLLTGDTALVQIGGWDAASGGPGALNVGPPVPVPASNTCDTAEAITGLGTTPFNTAGSATSGFGVGDPLCLPGTQSLIFYKDVFYRWTATNAGDHRFCMPSSSFTAFNIYSGEGAMRRASGPTSAWTISWSHRSTWGTR
jgi:hypothetical protein